VTESRPRIFVSYSRVDTAKADLLVEYLHSEGFAVWLDRLAVSPGDSFVEAINTALTDASYLLLLVSTNSLRSPWVNREWMSAMASKETVIIPIRLDSSKLPALLADISAIDWQDGSSEMLPYVARTLKSEVRPIPRDTFRAGYSEQPKFPEALSRRQVRLIAQRCLDEIEIDAYINDFGVARSKLEITNLDSRILSLIRLEDRDGRLGLFAEWIFRERTKCAQFEYDKLRGEDIWTGIKIIDNDR